MSPDAQLLNNAVKAANDAPEIRADVVAAAKQKLLSGELVQMPTGWRAA